MIIECAWCKARLGEKAPLADTSITHSICESCMKKLTKKNPGMEWETVVGTRSAPRVIRRAVGSLEQVVQKEARTWRLLETLPTVKTYSVGTYSSQVLAQSVAAVRASDYILKTNGNPGEAWHMGKMDEAEQSEKAIKKESLKDFYHGKAIAHFESALSERATKRIRKNPIAIFGLGNPPKEIHAKIEGIVYRHCLEVKAEKTGSWNKGLWKHPFARKSKVQILALDNGDLLLHSAIGTPLWKKA